MVLMLRRVGTLLLVMLIAFSAQAERISDIRNTKHNFSASVVPSLPEGASRTIQASIESQICAFCHTPHQATQSPRAPIWNRKLSGATYTPYTSTSLDAIDLGQPNTKSKLCLSCHDGTLAIGTVNVLNREKSPTISMVGNNADGTISGGINEQSGFTRRIGTDLTNDHPISFTYDASLAVTDGELRSPAAEAHLGNRSAGGHKPLLPLEGNQLECVTCHDPHVRDTSGENIKFLRVNRFQQTTPADGAFNRDNDIICLGCHEKSGWANSAHANPQVADETYADSAAELRDFTKGMQVWQAACLNCHDPHTAQGSRRLLREGTTDLSGDDANTMIATNGARYKQGGIPGIEQTCYACHSADGSVLQNQGTGNFQVPDIKTDFTTMRIRMPIHSGDQPAQEERHSISSGTDGGDFMETPQLLGRGDLSNRHAECTDCHNPHRVIQKRLFNADPSGVGDGQGTHNHGDGSGNIADNLSDSDMDLSNGDDSGVHNNLASGVLRGAWGVEPTAYAGTEFMSDPTAFAVKRGDVSAGASTAKSASYVTREYQICLKCHSNYGYDSPPPMGTNHSGGTASGTNSLFDYTNQAMEYQAPAGHEGEGTATGTGSYVGGNSCAQVNLGRKADGTPMAIADYVDPDVAAFVSRAGRLDSFNNCVNYEMDNHRAWHPVTAPTGRTAEAVVNGVAIGPSATNIRAADEDNWTAPFNAGVGIQTMYCTDCHGSDTDLGTVVPRGGDRGSVWGPHGSDNDFLLKGAWSYQTGQNTPDALCFKCHEYDFYGKEYPPGPVPSSKLQASGFSRDISLGVSTCLVAPAINLHTGHAQETQSLNFRCNYCHIAIPHGWKNKNFLANLNDVGTEVGLPTGGNQVRNKTTARYFRGPYYNGSVLKVVSFRKSGEWIHSSCGSAGDPGNGLVGGSQNPAANIPWMTDQGADSEACNNLP